MFTDCQTIPSPTLLFPPITFPGKSRALWQFAAIWNLSPASRKGSRVESEENRAVNLRQPEAMRSRVACRLFSVWGWRQPSHFAVLFSRLFVRYSVRGEFWGCWAGVTVPLDWRPLSLTATIRRSRKVDLGVKSGCYPVGSRFAFCRSLRVSERHCSGHIIHIKGWLLEVSLLNSDEDECPPSIGVGVC